MATVRFTPQNVEATVPAGSLLLEAARCAGVTLESPCDGSGSCGKCRAKVAGETRELVRESAHDFLTQAERDAGWVLACQATVLGDVTVEVEAAESDGLRILSEGHAVTVDIDPWFGKLFERAAGVTTVYAGGSPRFTEAGDTSHELYGVAVDIGTTTMVAALIDLRDGRELASASSLNPQARHAQDVLSRIKFGSTIEGLATLQSGVIEELNRLIRDAAGQRGISVEHIYEAVFSGNTTMLHLAVGANPVSLGKFPYTPVVLGDEHVPAAEIGLAIAPEGSVYLPPIMSAYVGADITSGVLAARLAEQPGVVLFVDIGTNGEMVLAVDGRLTATSTAAGPAFEGMNIACGMRASRGAVEQVGLSDAGVFAKTIGDAEPVGICGSGLLDAVGELAAKGGLDKNGRFQNNGASHSQPWKDRWELIDGKPVFRIAGPVFLSQKDIRQVQLAKAAVRAGIDVMLNANGLSAAQVDRVLIAGSFGFHLRTESLINLGLLPREFSGKVEFVGNTSKTGAQAFLVNRQVRARLKEVVRGVQVLELAKYPEFEKTFVKSLSF